MPATNYTSLRAGSTDHVVATASLAAKAPHWAAGAVVLGLLLLTTVSVWLGLAQARRLLRVQRRAGAPHGAGAADAGVETTTSARTLVDASGATPTVLSAEQQARGVAGSVRMVTIQRQKRGRGLQPAVMAASVGVGEEEQDLGVRGGNADCVGRAY